MDRPRRPGARARVLRDTDVIDAGPMVDGQRPMTRNECRSGERPCPWVSCKHNLYIDVNPVTGSIKLNFPDREIWELAETCALDIAERDDITLDVIGDAMNLTHERVRQIIVDGLARLRKGSPSPENPGGYLLSAASHK